MELIYVMLINVCTQSQVTAASVDIAKRQTDLTKECEELQATRMACDNCDR